MQVSQSTISGTPQSGKTGNKLGGTKIVDPNNPPTTVKTVIIYKDMSVPSKPWCADLHWENGDIWGGWQSQWRTKRDMIKNIRCTYRGAIYQDNKLVHA